MWINQSGNVGLNDGTSTLYVAQVLPQPGTKYRIYAAWGTHPVDGANKMQIGMTDGTTNWVSLIEDFDGSFDPVQFLLCSRIFEVPQILHSIKLLKTPVSGTWSDEPPARTRIDFFTQGAAINPTLAGTADVEWHWADGSVTTGNDPGVQDMSLTDGNNYLAILDPENVTEFWFQDIVDLTLDVNDILLMPNLTDLDINDTAITGDISGFSALTSLTSLRGDKSEVTGDISGFSALTSLTLLRLNTTGVTGDIAGFSALTLSAQIRLDVTGVTGAILDWSGYSNLSIFRCEGTGVLAADVDIMVADMWTNRVALGDNALVANLHTTNPVTVDTQDRIEGTGAYAGDGLVQAGCNVGYTAP